MKQRYIKALALFAGLLSACTVQDIPMPNNGGLLTFHAESGEAPETKTVLQSGTLVHWCPQDEIHVFYGNASGRFVSTNTSVAATADFKGELPGLQRNDNDAFWAVYPYAQEQSFDGNTVTLSLPATQTAVEGTFADDLFLSLARSTNTDLRFYNVCGGIKFSVGIDGVKKVVFSGKNNEPLAGKVKVGFDNNLPKVSTILDAERTITVNAPDGGTFTPEAWYYLVSLPASLTRGYVMELYGDSLLDTKEGNFSVDILRSVWGVLSDLGGDSSGEDFTGLSIEAIEDGTITISNPLGLTIEYSKDAKIWTATNTKPIEIPISSGEVVRLRGNNSSYAPTYEGVIPIQSNTYTNISSSGDCYIYGNIMSLIDAQGYKTATKLTDKYTFTSLFMDSIHLLSHPSKQLLLPATTLSPECYELMFSGCTSLTIAPELPAINLEDGCYAWMFSGCSSLKQAPVLPATNLSEGCYAGMFDRCGSLLDAPLLPATTMKPGCYDGMFSFCTSLTTAPALPAMNLAENCYLNMFIHCTSLTTAPSLPATTLAYSCYGTMFYECSSLQVAPELPAISLTEECYDCMFYGCSSLISAPVLPAPVLTNRCYFKMFYECINLKSIECRAMDLSAPRCTENWVMGVADSGTFVKISGMNDWSIGPSGIPEGWTVQDEGGSEFTGLCIEAILDGTITISNSIGLTIEYSKDANTWTASSSNPITIPVSSGDIVRLRGNNEAYATMAESTTIQCAADCYIYGNIMSLVSAQGYESITILTKPYTFSGLFNMNSHLVNHPEKELRLPATTLSNSCYYHMFWGCTGLTTAPDLPATSLSDNCYQEMFTLCSGITTPPALPATTLAPGCYSFMFGQCSGLTTAPSLPATTLATRCYSGLFDHCTGLTTAPQLPATSLAERCYYALFRGCTGLTKAPALPATTLAKGCYNNMFKGCTGLTTAPELPATSLSDECYTEMFSGCTSITAPPELRVKTLANSCYESMFESCTGLTTAPQLPATSLAERCYANMFKGCAGLTSAPALPAVSLASACYAGLFSGCTGITSAPELPATTMVESCYSSMFEGCDGIITAPALPATTLADNCYMFMFNGCRNLSTAPNLPANTLAKYCYYGMFSWCLSLSKAPELPARVLVEHCYSQMFSDCHNLNYIKALFTTTPSDDYTLAWVFRVSVSGTFVKNPEATWDVRGTNGIPEGWTIDGGEDSFTGLCLEAIEDGAISIANPLGLTIEYSKDARIWTSSSLITIEIPVTSGDIVRFRGNNAAYSDGSNHTVISCSSDCYVYGNVMSLVQVSGYETATVLTKPYTFKGLFFNKNNNAHLYNHPSADIILPATTLTEACYESMFDRCINLTMAPELPATRIRSRSYANMFAVCSSLVTAPNLPATVLDDNCYYGMFAYCINLKDAPKLPATTMAKECYRTMFFHCNSLTVAPELPATTLADSCYYNMFGECTSLIKAPDLPASYLPAGCYREMFYNCKKLNYIRCLATNVYNSLSYWVSGVATSGTFVQKSGVVWPDGESGIPSGWTVVFDE